MYIQKDKCWMCGRIRELTEHHIVPKILLKFVKGKKEYTVKLCKSCHAKLHLLLPKFYGDGSYKWNGVKMEDIFPKWKDWSEKAILDWEGKNEDGKNKEKQN